MVKPIDGPEARRFAPLVRNLGNKASNSFWMGKSVGLSSSQEQGTQFLVAVLTMKYIERKFAAYNYFPAGPGKDAGAALFANVTTDNLVASQELIVGGPKNAWAGAQRNYVEGGVSLLTRAKLAAKQEQVMLLLLNGFKEFVAASHGPRVLATVPPLGLSNGAGKASADAESSDEEGSVVPYASECDWHSITVNRGSDQIGIKFAGTGPDGEAHIPAVIGGVKPNTPAHRAGLKMGMEILAVDGIDVEDEGKERGGTQK